MRGLRQSQNVGVACLFIRGINRVLLAHIGDTRLGPALALAGSPSQFAQYARDLVVSIPARHPGY
jgi:hypothetical protein